MATEKTTRGYKWIYLAYNFQHVLRELGPEFNLWTPRVIFGNIKQIINHILCAWCVVSAL
jgi:hypothetical protein